MKYNDDRQSHRDSDLNLLEHPTNKNTESFFTLIPKGIGYEPPKFTSEVLEKSPSQKTSEPRNRLLRAFNYENTHLSDIERVLYMKSLFILNNDLPEKGDSAREALMLLVSDQDMLFKDGDDIYRSRYQNKAFLSERRFLNRATNSDAFREHLIQKTIVRQSNPGLQQAEILLRTIIHAAAENRCSVYDWLYSDRHIGITEQNRAEYSARVQIDGDGYLQNTKSELTSQRAWKSFNKRMREKKNPWDIWRLDLSKCVSSFKNLFPPKIDTSFITSEFCEKFIRNYLAEYIHMQQFLKLEFPDSEAYSDETRERKSFCSFSARYNRLTALADAFGNWTSVKLDNKTEWWTMTTAAKDPLVDEVAQCVQIFFENIGRPLRDITDSSLAGRICWVIYGKDTQCYRHTAKPFLLLAMVLTCRQRIVQGEDFLFDLEHMFPCQFSQISKAKQRYAEIQLLQQLHKAFSFSWAEQTESWNLYFSHQRNEIFSIEEVAFWRDLLNGEYEKLPVIGFQLCFLDYWSDCIPLHLEKLSYKPASDAHLGGYKRFWGINTERIRQVEEKISKQHMSRYIGCWKDPEQTNEHRREILEAMLDNFEDRHVLKDCPDDEYRCLVIETAIRERIRKQAQEKLCKWFKLAYGCSLKGALKKHII